MRIAVLKTLVTLSLVFYQGVCLPSVQAMSVGMIESEKVVFDSRGKIIVPYTNYDELRYLGSGLFFVSSHYKEAPRFYDRQGHNVAYKIPLGTTFVNAVRDPKKTDDFLHPTRDTFIYFEKDSKQGICDFDGNVLLPAKYKNFTQYVGDGIVMADGDKFGEEFIVKLDGTILGHIEPQGNGDDFRPAMFGGAWYSDGRRAVQHNLGPCSLMDLSGKLITKEKFIVVGGFENGISVARVLTVDGAVCILIDREGNTVKQFPKGFELNRPGRHNRYVYTTGQHPNCLSGLVNKNGDIVIPAKYARLQLFAEKYYLGRQREGNDELDIYDANGKLLLHCPHEVKNTTFKHPDSSGDLSVNLSTVTAFLTSRDEGVAVEWVTAAENASGVGLVNKLGQWVVRPIYLPYPLVVLPNEDSPVGQYAFELRTTAFSKDAWERGAHYARVGRDNLFSFFLKDHNLIGMPAVKVKDLLGEPQKTEQGMLSYLSFKVKEGDQESMIQMRLDENQCVSAWRHRSTSNEKTGQPPVYESEWETRDMMPGPTRPGGWPGALIPKRHK